MKHKWIIFIFIALLFLTGCEFEDLNFGDAFTVFPGGGKEPQEGEFKHPDSDDTAIVVIPDEFENIPADNNPSFTGAEDWNSGMDKMSISGGGEIPSADHSLHYKGDKKDIRVNEIPGEDMDVDYILFQWNRTDSSDWHVVAETESVDADANLGLELVGEGGGNLLQGKSGTEGGNLGGVVTLTSNSYYYIRVTYDVDAGPVGYKLIFRPYQ